jgi:DNA-binding transcriptional ArsR family regulator
MSDVFGALADPTRREILERLRREGPLSITQLTAGLPMSRQAVTKHLDLLEGAGLIRRELRGRERIHRIVMEPLEAIDAWLKPYAAAWDERLERLRKHLEEDDERADD